MTLSPAVTLDKPAVPVTTRRPSRLRRLLQRTLAIGAAVAGIGLLYQAIGTLLDQRMYPPPGQLYDVGGYRLHLHCTGAHVPGRPTVVLETLSGGTIPMWGWVQPELAQATRVCAYDRAGWGWSDSGPAPRDAQQTARELHTLLERAGIAGPYVLVGHSIGGLYVRQYAALYPDQVAGVVLIDSSHPDQIARQPAEAQDMDRTMTRLYPVFSVLNHLGVSRLAFALGAEFDFGDLPPQQRAETKAFWSSARRWDVLRIEAAARSETDAQVRATGDLGSLPLAVVSAGAGASPSWQALQADLATLSSNSLHLVVEGATHGSLVINPDDAHATSSAILQVLEAAQTGAPVSAR